jgi:hypothetical protein
MFMRRRKRRKHNSAVRHKRRRKHNPSMRGMTGSIMPTIKSGAVGAVGGLLADMVWDKANNYSAVMSIPYAEQVIKLLSAVLIGTFGDKVFRGHGKALAVGAATVTLHDLLRANLQSMAPSIFGSNATLGLGAYVAGAGPIVGGSTVPVQPLFDTAGVDNPRYAGMGAYLQGPSGMTDSYGVYSDDMIGY